MERIDAECVVIGAGVVGLAVARQMQLLGVETILLERNSAIGMETSSRNSEVIHAGIYYASGSLKAKLCVLGKQLLYDYCESSGVPYRRLGKIIVAVEPDEVTALEKYAKQALTNGVKDIEWLDSVAVAKVEPSIKAHAALLSPSTGIVDSHSFMASLLNDFDRAGGIVVYRSPVESGSAIDSGVLLRLGDSAQTQISAKRVVNCAGLLAPAVASSIDGIHGDVVPVAQFAIGHYFTLVGRSPFSRLVYPVPEPGGLGVHVTLDLAGCARFGPDVSWRASVDYRFDDSRATAFYHAIRRYFPGLQDGQLAPGYTGIRPKIVGADGPISDFLIQWPEVHGVNGLVNLFGIESPGLTASLAIAQEVGARFNGA